MVGESGSGKSVSFLTVMGLINRKSAVVEGEVFFQGQDLLKLSNEELQRHPRDQDRDDLPGPDDVAAPVLQGRRPDRRGDPAHENISKKEAGDRAVEMLRRVEHPAARGTGEAVPARVLRRHAPAGDDRDGAVAQPRPADRRRAHDRARRDGAGADPRADRPAAERVQHRGRADHPRPRASWPSTATTSR